MDLLKQLYEIVYVQALWLFEKCHSFLPCIPPTLLFFLQKLDLHIRVQIQWSNIKKYMINWNPHLSRSCIFSNYFTLRYRSCISDSISSTDLKSLPTFHNTVYVQSTQSWVPLQSINYSYISCISWKRPKLLPLGGVEDLVNYCPRRTVFHTTKPQ